MISKSLFIIAHQLGDRNFYPAYKTLIQKPNLKEEWKKKREKLLKDKIDVTAFMVWFIKNYPESFKGMKKNHEIQYRLK